MTVTFVFWTLLGVAAYPYVGYPLVAGAIVGARGLLRRGGKRGGGANGNGADTAAALPRVTLLVAAYNEQDVVEAKMANTAALDYPADLLDVVWVTDGSDDATPALVARHPEVRLMHQSERRGKIHAVQRALATVGTPVVVFCDANTMLTPQAVRRMVETLADPGVGCVAGAKRVVGAQQGDLTAAGEGLYWRVEDRLRRLDSALYTNVGAPGELFAIRRELFQPVPDDTILDDFLITLRVARRGYRIAYQPKAVAVEYGSASVGEEMKRKVRIAAGCFQAMAREPWLFNAAARPALVFQFVSRKFMRWVTTPLLLPVLLPLNVVVYAQGVGGLPVAIVLAAQVSFYAAALLGRVFRGASWLPKVIFAPYYFVVSNLAQYRGLARYLAGGATVKWERSKRIVG